MLAGLGLMVAAWTSAQTFTTLHSFTGLTNDGAEPYAGLILSGNTLYGTTESGGSSRCGTVFAVNTDCTGFTNLHSFTGLTNDGGEPYAGLILSGNTLYGTTAYGGSSGLGNVFAVNTNGTGFTNLHSFTRSDGVFPQAGLVLSGNALYGTTSAGGAGGGTVYAVSTDGTGFANLHSFTNNGSGTESEAGLVLSGNTLYGTQPYEGSSGLGMVFAINTNGIGFTNLHSFTGSDGIYPDSGLILSGNTLYGTAQRGGSSGNGTVFAVNINGTSFTIVYSFTVAINNYSNSDGAEPSAGLVLSGNTLYGTAFKGGSSGAGTVFAVNTNGTGFMNLHNFTGNDGSFPLAGLIVSGNTLYGTATGGGSSIYYGTVFSISFAPQLTINLSETNVILAWPTNVDGFSYAGYTLQSTANLSPAIWNTNLPPPVIVNGQYTVTNSISGTQMFYQLSQ